MNTIAYFAVAWADNRCDLNIRGYVRTLGLYDDERLLVMLDEAATIFRVRLLRVQPTTKPQDLNGLTFVGRTSGGAVFLHPVDRASSGATVDAPDRP